MRNELTNFLLSKKVKEVHISEISHGDTIIHLDGYLRTVCNSNIKNSEFMGITIFGDSYNLGTIKVKKIN